MARKGPTGDFAGESPEAPNAHLTSLPNAKKDMFNVGRRQCLEKRNTGPLATSPFCTCMCVYACACLHFICACVCVRVRAHVRAHVSILYVHVCVRAHVRAHFFFFYVHMCACTCACTDVCVSAIVCVSVYVFWSRQLKNTLLLLKSFVLLVKSLSVSWCQQFEARDFPVS